jgi:hypothetical protein
MTRSCSKSRLASQLLPLRNKHTAERDYLGGPVLFTYGKSFADMGLRVSNILSRTTRQPFINYYLKVLTKQNRSFINHLLSLLSVRFYRTLQVKYRQ